MIETMSNSCKRNANLVKTFRVTPAENDLLLSAAKQKCVGISTFCKIAALESAEREKSDDGSRPGIGPHTQAIGEMLAAACIIQRLLRVTEAGNPAEKGIGHHDEILGACSRIIDAANELVGYAS
ncbi:MAG: hypothetical protein LAT81_12410 [Oceanicaulis sp.]|nr:hypothetical protein [Oceanicaulis sp.]